MAEAPLGAWLGSHRAELRLGLRITIAGLLTFALGHLLGLAQSYWAVLTAVIVMQASVGGSLKATLDRFVGSLGGAAWGVVVSLAIPHETILSLGLALAVALVPLGLLTALRPTYRVAPITAIILLLTPLNQEAGPVLSAAHRMMEIGLGSIVALGVALFVLPARAHAMLAEAAAQALTIMAELILGLMAGLESPSDPAAIQSLHDDVRKAIARAEAAADEASRERAHHLTDAADPEPLCRTLRRVRNDLVMIGRAAAAPLPETVRAGIAGPASRAAPAIAAFLRAAAPAVTGKAPLPTLDAVAHAIADYGAAMAELRGLGTMRELPDEAVGRIFSLAFALEQLLRDLGDLHDRVQEFA
ncbi:MAG: hypothetical protein JWL84_6109 [Rhodospirillales bacterium]|nr:hypothetical protein [Rhodospirillales bacterium]